MHGTNFFLHDIHECHACSNVQNNVLTFERLHLLTFRVVCFRGEVVAKCEHQEDVLFADIGRNFLPGFEQKFMPFKIFECFLL